MPGFELFEESPRRPDPAFPDVTQSLADALCCIGLRRDIEEPLIGLGILHNGRGLSVNRQHHRTFGFPELFQKIARSPLEYQLHVNADHVGQAGSAHSESRGRP